MTENQLELVRCIAENRLAEAKKYAICCCVEDNTKKNKYAVQRCKNLLENGALNAIEVPYNIKGMAAMEDVSSFREDRYFLSIREETLFNQIKGMNDASLKLMELGIPYLNAILLTGESGTGKTTFGKYVAHKLDLPFLYINFSWLIDSYMGKTSQNLRNVFDFARLNKCLLMLDEIDCIASKRKANNDGASKEMSNTTVSLLQELDMVKNDSLIIAATNIPDAIDPAIKRRFSIQHEVTVLSKNENVQMIKQYLDTTGYKYSLQDIHYYVDSVACKPQAVILNHLIQCIANSIIENKAEVILTN